MLGDVDGDGADEIVSVSRRSDQFKVGRLVVWEPDTLVTHISDRSRDASYYYDIQLFDVNEDGDQEILVAASGTLDAVIEIYDYAPDGTFSRIWKNVVEPDGSGFYSVAAADIDGNGTLEIIGGSGKRTSASDGTRIYVYDFATGFEKWHTIDLAVSYSSIPQLLIHDFDGDGTLEIAGMVENGDVSIFANNSALKATIPGKFHSMRLGPEIPGQSTPLLLGNKFGEIKPFQWKGSHFQEVVNLPLASDPIDGFTLLAQNQVLASIFGTLNLFDSNSGNLLWESKFYGTDFGAKVLPLGNGDYVTAGFSGLYILGIR